MTLIDTLINLETEYKISPKRVEEVERLSNHYIAKGKSNNNYVFFKIRQMLILNKLTTSEERWENIELNEEGLKIAKEVFKSIYKLD